MITIKGYDVKIFTGNIEVNALEQIKAFIRPAFNFKAPESLSKFI